jgi:histidine triad (HIT) family protein
MATIFSRIIAGEIPCYKVAENDKFFAFLDINPLEKGHTLVVPKQEVDYIFDLSDEDLAAMHVFAKQVACAIKKAFPCQKVGESCYRTGSTSCTYSFNSYSKGIGYVFRIRN